MMDLKFIADGFTRLANLLGQVITSQNVLTRHMVELERKQKMLELELRKLRDRQ